MRAAAAPIPGCIGQPPLRRPLRRAQSRTDGSRTIRLLATSARCVCLSARLRHSQRAGSITDPPLVPPPQRGLAAPFPSMKDAFRCAVDDSLLTILAYRGGTLGKAGSQPRHCLACHHAALLCSRGRRRARHSSCISGRGAHRGRGRAAREGRPGLSPDVPGLGQGRHATQHAGRGTAEGGAVSRDRADMAEHIVRTRTLRRQAWSTCWHSRARRIR